MPEVSIINGLSSETIIFGGLTLVSLSLVTLVWRISVRYNNHMSSTIQKNTEAWIQNAKAQQRISDTLESFSQCLSNSAECITKASDRMLRASNKIDKVLKK